VVELGEHGAPATIEPVDDHEMPQRAGAVERVLHEAGGEVVQLAECARGGQRDMAEVVVEVELRIGCPTRGRQPPDAGHHPLPESRYLGDRVGDSASEVLDVRGPVAHDDHAAAGVQPRVLLDVPHERLEVRHPALETDSPDRFVGHHATVAPPAGGEPARLP
jgi:hypothetical protein